MNLKNYFSACLFVLCMFIAHLAFAASAERLGMIDKNDVYDIYYAGNSDGAAFVAKRVKIMRIEEINGVDFLVFINDSGFNAKSKEGFILFSTIRAIVPDSTFTIVGGDRLKQY